jgi:hypothetical protein
LLLEDANMTATQAIPTSLVRLVQAEYLEMPGLQLTRPQVRRQWGLDQEICDALLDELIAQHVLRRTSGDEYVLDGTLG